MEALNLPGLAQAIRAPPKPSTMKRAKPRAVEKQIVEVRRSSRLASMPAPVYKEVSVVGGEDRSRRYSTNRHGDLENLVYVSEEARSDAIERAEAFQLGLGSDYLTFVAPMIQSHVTDEFWLGLPGAFCRKNLPTREATITLLDENGDESSTVYLAKKTGLTLSGEWREFAIDHQLVDGDALVFQLIRPTTFKVYILRVERTE